MKTIRSNSAHRLLATTLLSLTILTPAQAEITVNRTATLNANNPVEIIFDASDSDKLVVVVTGEHGFNQTGNGVGADVFYDGVLLTQVVNRDTIRASEGPPVVDVDDTWNDIWYLDNPATSTGLISTASVARGSITVFALSGTAEGAGNTVIGDRDSRSAELTTSATGSIVIASFGMGGAGNTADVQNVSADEPLTQSSATKNGGNRNWDGHVTGYAIIPTVGPNTFSFTGGNQDGSHVIAAEFLAADGSPGQPFAITDIDYASDSTQLTLTWSSTEGQNYTVQFSPDMTNWEGDLDDGINADPGEFTTKTFDLSLAGLASEGRLYFRVLQQE